MRKTVLLTAAVLAVSLVRAGDLRSEIERIASGCDARVGVAVILPGGDTLTVGGDREYPMMSVMKLPQAMAAADSMERGGIALSRKVMVEKSDLPSGTWSPLRDRYPDGGVELTVEELIDYSLQQSDNNACDLLFRLFGGPESVEAYLGKSGVAGMHVEKTEAEMHADPVAALRNRTTPMAAARMVERLLEEARERPLFAHISATISRCRTGLDRLHQPLEGTGATIGHKTGSGGVDSLGRLVAVNDAGFVLLPDGRRYVVAVFVADSGETPAATAAIIAAISRAVYRYVDTQCADK